MTISRIARIRNQSLAIWKLGLSFRKSSWEFHDYPIAVRLQVADPADGIFNAPRFKLEPYIATIVNWHLSGSGDTPEEAVANLRQTFEAVRQKREVEGKIQPRPGKAVPIEFASQDRVNKHEALSEDFVRRILGLEWAWISDDSSLWDFHANATNEELQEKIREVYGVDVSDIESAKLSDILDRIASRQEKKPVHG